MANAGQVRRAFPSSTGVAPFLGWLPKGMWGRAKEFFAYSAEFLPVAASGTATFETAIQADSDFVAVSWVRTVVQNAAPATFVDPAPLLVTVLDTGSGRNVFDRPQHIENLYGDAQLPAYLPMPAIFRASSSIQTTVTNIDAVNALDVRIAYLGFKVFAYPAGRQYSAGG